MKIKYKYLIAFGTGLLITFIIVLSKNVFSLIDLKSKYHILVDGFFVAGIIIIGAGLLVFSSNGGTFDMLSFGVIKVIDLFRRDLSKVKYQTFYDYRLERSENKGQFLYLIIVGTFFIITSLIFLWLYYQ